MIDNNWLFVGFILLGAFLTWFASLKPNVVVAIAASVAWLSMATWLFFSPIPIFTFGLTGEIDWSKMFVWVLVLMAFVPFLLHMNVEIRHDKDGYSWKEYGSRPKTPKMSSYEAYQAELHRRLNKVRRR